MPEISKELYYEMVSKLKLLPDYYEYGCDKINKTMALGTVEANRFIFPTNIITDLWHLSKNTCRGELYVVNIYKVYGEYNIQSYYKIHSVDLRNGTDDLSGIFDLMPRSLKELLIYDLDLFIND